MKDFDSELLESDLSFRIGGEDFKMRYVRPEVLASWEEDPTDQTSEAALKLLDDRIMLFLNGDDDSRARWEKIRAREEDAVPMVQVNELLRWMIEVQTSRPTNTPSPSAPGRGRTAATSKAA